MQYLSIDLETTGLDRKKCSAIQFAAVLEDTAYPGIPVTDLPHIEVTFGTAHGVYWEPYALEMHKRSGLYARTLYPQQPVTTTQQWMNPKSELTTVDARAGWIIIEDWIRQHANKQKMWVAGKNFGGFDSHFIPETVTSCFKHRYIDPGSLFMDWVNGPKSLEQLLGEPVEHTALADARAVVTVLRKSYPETMESCYVCGYP